MLYTVTSCMNRVEKRLLLLDPNERTSYLVTFVKPAPNSAALRDARCSECAGVPSWLKASGNKLAFSKNVTILCNTQ